jgi:hypothetical protein
MKAKTLADKLVSTARVFILISLMALPLNAAAEYYVVYDTPAPCGSCHAKRVYYRPVHHRAHCSCKKKYYHTAYRKRNHYSVTVYYPVPMSQERPCGCSSGCDGFLQPTYYWTSAPYQVYYARPSDRLVANRYEETYENPSLDTSTADNDIY